jgi:hypothetical protein
VGAFVPVSPANRHKHRGEAVAGSRFWLALLVSTSLTTFIASIVFCKHYLLRFFVLFLHFCALVLVLAILFLLIRRPFLHYKISRNFFFSKKTREIFKSGGQSVESVVHCSKFVFRYSKIVFRYSKSIIPSPFSIGCSKFPSLISIISSQFPI